MLGACALTGCRGGDDGERVRVVAGAYPVAYAAEQIGGASVSVENLTPPGAEPHDLELSARDVERVRKADVVLLLGERFQPALADAAREADGRVVDLLAGSREPHVWLDPVRYAEVGAAIGFALRRQEAADRFARRLTDLHAEFRRGIADCRRRTFVTSHAAFGALARRYRLREVAIAGLSPEAEPTPRELAEIVARVRASGATTVFTEPLLSRRLAETVARETGARIDVLDPVEGLPQERLDAGENYFTAMRANLRALRRALQCS